jgi:kynurenine formamidase
MSSAIFLSHLLDSRTPSYGNRNAIQLENKRSIDCGDHANESFLHMSVHQGTHIDMPLHFHANGQSIENFPASFWIFDHPLLIEIDQTDEIICDGIIQALEKIPDGLKKKCDLLMVKTGMAEKRYSSEFWENNPGFSPDLYHHFKEELSLLRVFGFDSISLTGFQHRESGKKAHQQFLNPDTPILLLEDMKLDEVSSESKFKKIIISPLRLVKSDGLPCTVIGLKT